MLVVADAGFNNQFDGIKLVLKRYTPYYPGFKQSSPRAIGADLKPHSVEDRLLIIDTPETETFWHKACEATDIDPVTPRHAGAFAKPADVDVPAFVDELARMTCDGKQRGTQHMQREFEHENIRIREPGDGWIMTADVAEPLSVMPITNVDIKPFNRVGEVFAALEGEGDPSLEQWRDDRTVARDSLELVSRP